MTKNSGNNMRAAQFGRRVIHHHIAESIATGVSAEVRQRREPRSPCISYTALDTSHAVLMKNTIANFILFLASVAICYYESQIYFENHYQEDLLNDVLRVGNCLISIAQIWLVIQHCSVYGKHWIDKRFQLKPQGVYWEKWLALEILIHLIMLPPRLNYEVTFYLLGTSQVLTLSDLELMLVMLRSYHLPRMLFWISRFSKRKSFFYA